MMIKIAKLVSQEFVIGRSIDNLFANVAKITFVADQNTGAQNIKLVPYMHPITNSMAKIITAEKIIYMEDAPTQLQASYLEMIKSIIEQSQENQNGPNAISGADTKEAGATEGEVTVPE